MSQELVTTSPSTALATMPSDGEFSNILRQAEYIARSGIVPANYQTRLAHDGHILQDGTANVVVATLTGRTFGWDALTAMRNIHVIEGTATLKPEAMLGLVRRAGHAVSGETSTTKATVTGTRRDTGDTMTVVWTKEDAETAKLWGKKNWATYPQSMLWARAVAQLCRMLFPDVVLGLGYVPEEIGANVDENGVPSEVLSYVVQPVVEPVIAEGFELRATASTRLIAAVKEVGGDMVEARAAWDAGNFGDATTVESVVVDVLIECECEKLAAKFEAARPAAVTAPADDNTEDAVVVEDEPTTEATEAADDGKNRLLEAVGGDVDLAKSLWVGAELHEAGPAVKVAAVDALISKALSRMFDDAPAAIKPAIAAASIERDGNPFAMDL